MSNIVIFWFNLFVCISCLYFFKFYSLGAFVWLQYFVFACREILYSVEHGFHWKCSCLVHYLTNPVYYIFINGIRCNYFVLPSFIVVIIYRYSRNCIQPKATRIKNEIIHYLSQDWANQNRIRIIFNWRQMWISQHTRDKLQIKSYKAIDAIELVAWTQTKPCRIQYKTHQPKQPPRFIMRKWCFLSRNVLEMAWSRNLLSTQPQIRENTWSISSYMTI